MAFAVDGVGMGMIVAHFAKDTRMALKQTNQKIQKKTTKKKDGSIATFQSVNYGNRNDVILHGTTIGTVMPTQLVLNSNNLKRRERTLLDT